MVKETGQVTVKLRVTVIDVSLAIQPSQMKAAQVVSVRTMGTRNRTTLHWRTPRYASQATASAMALAVAVRERFRGSRIGRGRGTGRR